MSNNKTVGEMTRTYLEKNGWNEWAKYVLMSLEELKKQQTEAEDKIDSNKEMYIQAINSLEIAFTKEMGDLTAEIKVLKTKTTQRASVYAALIALLPTLAYILHQIIAV